MAMLASNFVSSDDIVDHLQQAYYSCGCDGLFLSDISYLGVRLPVERLLARLNPQIAVIDGAQPRTVTGPDEFPTLSTVFSLWLARFPTICAQPKESGQGACHVVRCPTHDTLFGIPAQPAA